MRQQIKFSNHHLPKQPKILPLVGAISDWQDLHWVLQLVEDFFSLILKSWERRKWFCNLKFGKLQIDIIPTPERILVHYTRNFIFNKQDKLEEWKSNSHAPCNAHWAFHLVKQNNFCWLSERKGRERREREREGERERKRRRERKGEKVKEGEKGGERERKRETGRETQKHRYTHTHTYKLTHFLFF